MIKNNKGDCFTWMEVKIKFRKGERQNTCVTHPVLEKKEKKLTSRIGRVHYERIVWILFIIFMIR